MAWHAKFAGNFHSAFPQYRAEGSIFASADFFTKLQTALATNTTPDVNFRDSSGDNVVAEWDLGLIVPVNDLMEDLFKTVRGKDKFDAAAIERFTTPKGDIVGVPMAGGTWVWWYRQDLLKEAGLTPPAGHWDWKFLLNAVNALHKPPQQYGLAASLGRVTAGQVLIGSLILNNGGHFVSPDLKDVVFDSPEVREAVDLVRELAAYTPPGATTWSNADVLNAVDLGAPMGIYSGAVMGDVYAKNPSLIGKMSNTQIPYNKVPRTFSGIGCHGIYKGGKNLQGAKELVKFSMQKEQLTSYLGIRPGNSTSSIPSYDADPSVAGLAALKAWDPQILATMSEAGKNNANFLKEGPGWNINSKSGALVGSLILADVMQKVVVGKESTQSAVTSGAQQIRDIMTG
jgi:multiple sugar transport system substrate-binding protein